MTLFIQPDTVFMLLYFLLMGTLYLFLQAVNLMFIHADQKEYVYLIYVRVVISVDLQFNHSRNVDDFIHTVFLYLY